MVDRRAQRKIGVIMGGVSAERDVSLATGEAVARALEERGHRVTRLIFGAGSPGVDEMVRASSIDVAFLAVHGRGGEDGCVQGLLELLSVPYTGSGVLASALAMDKLKAKELFRLHGVSTPPYYLATADHLAGGAEALAALHGSFGFPCIVKPRSEGSSVGITRADDLQALVRGVALALAHDDGALVERFVEGMEVTVGILDGRVLGALEIAPREGLYDYAAKYTSGTTEYLCPPRLEGGRTRAIMKLAARAAEALGCTGACRVDLRVTPGENEYVLEVNTLPGMTATSLLPKIAKAAGIDYGALCEAILDGARLHAGIRKPVLPARSALAASAATETDREGAANERLAAAS